MEYNEAEKQTFGAKALPPAGYLYPYSLAYSRE